MKRNDLVKLVSEKTGVKRKTAELVIRTFEETIKEQIIAGEPVTITGLMKIEKKTVASRQRFIPATQELCNIGSHDVVKVTISRTLKDKVK